jgi:NADPH:quinone reductase-like Zn-dependent oxidoreductase
VGGNVTEFKAGDEVFGTCKGALAEYACASESALTLKPENVTFEQAASAPVAALTALQGLRDKGQVQAGQRVLINGAAGGVGTFAVQIAKWLGAEVTGVCSSRNVAMVRTIGADRVFDYTQEDFTRSGQCYDAILDVVGNHSLAAFRQVLNPKGRYVTAGGGGPDAHWFDVIARPIEASLLSLFVSQKLIPLLTRANKKDLIVICDLMRLGAVTPVIDKRFALNEAAEAIRYLEEGHARGKVVIALD